MPYKKYNKHKPFVIAVLLVIFLDQLSKFLIRKELIAIPYSCNTGSAFGILQNQTALLIWFSLIVIGVILYSYDKIGNKIIVPVAFILGGTIANLIDRIAFGCVTDFIDFKIWPSFNIADSALTIGVLWLVVYLVKKK